MATDLNQQLRELPSVDEVLQQLDARCPRELLVNETRRVIDEARTRVRQGQAVEVGRIPEAVLAELHSLRQPSLRPVINATGVILHTNLGRAPLPSFSPVQGYCNLEYDLASGRRGKRDTHLESLLQRLTGHVGIVVNNNAAAVWLVLNELAAGDEVIVSRGELIEIGDGFRIPDIMARSGAILREVGTTNRTRIEDYGNAISERTRLIMRVHPSNFQITGFTERPRINDLALLAREREVTLYEDLGSGCLADLRPWGVEEPLVADSLRAGVDLVSFSGDKLLGGPQAGIIAGNQALVSRCRRNPMFRALRCDKMVYAALESALRHTLFCQWDRIPVLHMISTPAERVRERAERLVHQLDGIRAEVKAGVSLIGGGATPDQSLPTFLIFVSCDDADSLEQTLRAGDPPVVARIEDERLLIDLRTVREEDEQTLILRLREGYARSR